MSKQEATRLADALRALHDSKQPHPTGPHGQMMGEESWRIVASGNQLYALMEAHDLLRRWPDGGEPVAYQYLFDGYNGPVWRNDSGPWNGMQPKASRPLYTAPPAKQDGGPSTAQQLGDDLFRMAMTVYRDKPTESDFAPPEFMDTLRAAVEKAPRLPEQPTDDDPPCLTDSHTDADRIDALERENAALQEAAERMKVQVVLPMQQAMHELKDERDALRKDAERYRWLRDNMVQDGDDYDGFMSTRNLFPRGNEYPVNLDAAIDAAIAQKVDAG